MADINVRKLRFEFNERIDFDLDDEAFSNAVAWLGLSLTMPYLEPYLIRTMRTAIPQIDDPQLVADAKRFSQQEAHHFRNHISLNEHIRSHFPEGTARALLTIEEELGAEYKLFSRDKSLRFNLAYAEGFEAMTCAISLSMIEFDGFQKLPGGEIWAWHMAEEIEHRTVAFNVFEHLVGSYPYRLAFGFWAQYHYLGYIYRLAQCMARALGRSLTIPKDRVYRDFLRRYARTFWLGYDPSDIELPQTVHTLLARYSAQAT